MTWAGKANIVESPKLGTFEVTSGKLVVSDPCYSRGTWCMGILEGVRKGTWTARIFISDEKEWGKRVAELEVLHSGVKDPPALGLWENTGIDVGVDSGQAGFWDDSKFGNGEGAHDDPESFYGKACNKTLHGGQAGVMDGGVVSSSGYGDGGYDCYVLKDGDDIVGAKIIFITEDDSEIEVTGGTGQETA